MTGSRRDFVIVSGIAVACCFAHALYPGDAPFINDDAALLYRALRFNQSHQLATAGLRGTKGVIYGPLAIWIYQAMLVISHDCSPSMCPLTRRPGLRSGTGRLRRSLSPPPCVLLAKRRCVLHLLTNRLDSSGCDNSASTKICGGSLKCRCTHQHDDR